MIDPHRAFVDWVLDGTPGEPSRTAAIHASACDDCTRIVEAFDELSRIDIEAIALPAVVRPEHRRRPSLRAVRWAAAAVATGLVVGTVAFGLAQDDPLPRPGTSPRPSITEGVLGGDRLAEATTSASIAASTTPLPTASPSSPDADPLSTDRPPVLVTAVPVASSPQPGAPITPPPTLAATPVPTPLPTPPAPTPTPTPTASATSFPTAVATSSPTVTATPSPTP